MKITGLTVLSYMKITRAFNERRIKQARLQKKESFNFFKAFFYSL